MDFFTISVQYNRKGEPATVFPDFIYKRCNDLMIKGHAFYAVLDPVNEVWSRDEQTVVRIVDNALQEYISKPENQVSLRRAKVQWMGKSCCASMDLWKKYLKNQVDHYHKLDQELIFVDQTPLIDQYATKKLPYSLSAQETPAWDILMSTLYDKDERFKLEWAIGCILSGDSKKTQKFIVLYGEPGSGKSTYLHIVEQLFDGYWKAFNIGSVTASGKDFALAQFGEDPLVGIEHDGDLSHIETNSKLNSLVSHETMIIDEKFKTPYQTTIDTFLFMGTNKPVRITDAKSGIIRRLIDVHPSGRTLSMEQYDNAMEHIKFELGGIANHCLKVYLSNKTSLNKYVPYRMFTSTNDLYNFLLENYDAFASEEYVTLKVAWQRYKEYIEYANLKYPLIMRQFSEELRVYFNEYSRRKRIGGQFLRNVYSGFKTYMFGDEEKPYAMSYSAQAPEDNDKEEDINIKDLPLWLHLDRHDTSKNPLDQYISECPAQYAISQEDGTETPRYKWDKVTTKLKDILTTRTHYVRPPKYLIVIDFDLKDPVTKEKSLELNLKAASKFPKTYAEASKSGKGLHLHYIYDGDPSNLSILYAEGIEVKVYMGKSALRRRLTLCNEEDISHLSSGLPLKEENKVLSWDGVQSEKQLRTMIMKNLNKEYHKFTKPSVDYIKYILDSAYENGVKYDVRDLRPSIMNFAAGSSNNADYCMGLVCDMKFQSDEPSENTESSGYLEKPIAFFDVEIFPNLFVLCYKKQGGDGGKDSVISLINPSAMDIQNIVDSYRLIGFNNRDYDNHILYSRILGYSVEQLYELSQRIIGKSKNAKFGEAYNLSFTDIYDFSNTKQSLKKWEIELGIHHQELGLRWDTPVPKERWEEVADYCKNDVIATEAVFDHLKEDWAARQILAAVSGLTVNDTTNSHSTRIIFGTNRNPQSSFNYPDLSKEFPGYEFSPYGIDKDRYIKDEKGKPICTTGHKSIFMGEDPSEGGYVYTTPGIHYNVALLDIASLHPSTIENLELFGPYTANFSEIKSARVAVKHKDWNAARRYLKGALSPFLEGIESQSKEEQQKVSDDLSFALKIVINSVYGLTSASFPNAFKDPRNVDNVVAKRGALFMISLKHEVQKRGFVVAHIKTDSIKIPDATPEIIQFVMGFGKRYGYSFEHEATYAKMCLVNKAVYVAKYDEFGERTKGGRHANQWTATGTQFMVPYIFKTLFSHEPIEFSDMCETKSVSGGAAMYIDFDEQYISRLAEIAAEKKKLENRLKAAVKKDPMLEEAYKGQSVLHQDLEHYSDICKEEDSYHNYKFVGRTGQFCPMIDGIGAGELMREDNGVYASVNGTKGYKWLETEEVIEAGLQDSVDIRYYRALVDDAYATIAQYGDPEEFIS